MKQCPDCKRLYNDKSLNFCLEDGERLLDEWVATEAETRVLKNGADRPENATVEFEAEKTNEDGRTGNYSKQTYVLLITLVAAISVASYLVYRNFGSSSNRRISAVAIMPFVNGSGNPDLEYLSDGITETLISTLSQLQNVSIKARSSVFRYKGKDIDPRTVGSELSVQAVLNGRVVQRGEDLILNIELIDSSNDNVLWSQNYNRKAGDLVILQNDIARDVSEKLLARLSGAQQPVSQNYTADPKAYNLYLRGLYHFNKRTPKDMQRSVEYFQQAVAVDPNYSLGYSGLADAYAVLPGYSHDLLPAETVPKGREAALKALSLNDNLSQAHVSLGRILNGYDYDFNGAEHEFKRAIELDPKNAEAYAGYGHLLIQIGKFDEGLVQLRKALELEPLSLPYNRLYGTDLYLARRYREGEDQLRKTVDLDPSFSLAYYSLAGVLHAEGKNLEAVEAVAKGFEAEGKRESATAARQSFSMGGWKGFQRFRVADQSRIGSNYLLSWAYLNLDEKEKALDLLRQSMEQRESFATLMKVDPQMDPLREDRRFQELIKRIGFPE
jgi:TolB-like protein